MKKINRKKVFIIGMISVAVIGAFVFWSVWMPKERYAEEFAKMQDLDTYHSFEGNIEAEDSQLIYATATSTIQKIYVHEGDLVSKGDLLYELEGDNAESNLTQAQASVTSAKVSLQDAKSSLSRMTELYNAGAASLTDYEQAKSSCEVAAAQLTQAQANYDSARNSVDDLKGYAEISGEISDIYAEENDTLLSGTEIMDITNYDRLVVQIKIDEFDLDAVQEGDAATAVITALNKEIGGMVSDISKKAEVVNGVSFFDAKVILEPNEDLKVGLSAEIRIRSEYAAGVVTISMQALQFGENNKPYVLMERSDGTVVPKPVSVGINNGISVEIKDGLKVGDRVLIPEQDREQADPGLDPPGGGRIINRATQS